MTAPQKLVGGHATRNLTPGEARKLYEAALRDQAIFDDLMDEDALGALLEDPEVRRTVLSALHARPWWRRPWALAAAATMLAVGLATWNGFEEGRTRSGSREREKVAISTPAKVARTAGLEREQAPASEPSPVMTAERTEKKSRPGIDLNEQALPPAPQPIPPSAASLPAPDRSEFQPKPSPAPAMALRSRDTLGNAMYPEGAPQDARGFWRLQPLPEGGWRLLATRAPGRFLYLLQMDPDGPTQAIPQATDGSFRLSPRQGRTWELLVLDAPTTDPVGIPKGDLPPGHRIRIKP